MGELGDILGDDFEEQYESETQRRREQRNRVGEEELKAICYKAVEGDGFEGEKPRFTYEGGDVPHDVLLMETYDGDLGKFKNSFKNGGMSVGMFHLDTLMSCAFGEDMMDIVNKIQPNTYYIVVGRYEEKTEMRDGTKETYYNVNPVRGIVPLPQAKKFAENYESSKSQSSIEEQKQDQGTSDTTETEDEEDDTPSPEEQTVKIFEAVSNKKPELLHNVADGDEDAFNTLVSVVNDHAQSDISEDTVYDTFEAEIEEIDDEEEEDDDIDLGGLDDSDGLMGDETDEPSGSENESESSDADDEDDGDNSVDDWF